MFFRWRRKQREAVVVGSLLGTGSTETKDGMPHVATMPDGRKVFTFAEVDPKKTTATRLVFTDGSFIEPRNTVVKKITVLIVQPSGGEVMMSGTTMKNSTFTIR